MQLVDNFDAQYEYLANERIYAHPARSLAERAKPNIPPSKVYVNA